MPIIRKSMLCLIYGYIITLLVVLPHSASAATLVFERGEHIYKSGELGNNIQAVARGEDPAISPDGRKVAFRNELGVFINNIGGGGNTRVSDANGRHPTWSPDSQSLVFTLDAVLWRVDLDMLKMPGYFGDRVYRGNDREHIKSPAWSPDGSKIAFESFIDDENRSVIRYLHVRRHLDHYHYDLDNATIQINREGNKTHSNPSWDPTGSSIFFDYGITDNVLGDPDRAIIAYSFQNNSFREIVGEQLGLIKHPVPYISNAGLQGTLFARSNFGDPSWFTLFKRELDSEQNESFLDEILTTPSEIKSPDIWPKIPRQFDLPRDDSSDNVRDADDPCAGFDRFPELQRQCREAEADRQRRLEEDRRRLEEQRRQAAERNRPGQNWPSPGQLPQQNLPNNSLPGLGDMGKNYLNGSGLLPKSDNSLLKSQVRLLKGAKYRRGKGKRGFVRVRVKCYAMPGKRCKGTLKLYTKKRHKIGRGKKIRILVGEQKFSLTPNLKAKGKNKSVSETEILGPKKSKTVTEMQNEKVVNRPRTIKVRLGPATQAGWSATAKRIASKAVSATVLKLNKKHTVRLMARAAVISKEIDDSKISKTTAKTLVVKQKRKRLKKRR